jgi:hypothetical protein
LKRRIALCFVSFFLFGFLFAADILTAQTIAYRRASLASNLSNVANHVTPGLVDPWGIAFLPDQPLLLADNNAGRVTAHATVTPVDKAASAVLTVTASASALHFGFLIPDLIRPLTVLAAMALLSLAMWHARSLAYPRLPQFAVLVTAIVMLGIAISGCGGNASSSPANRGTATINVIARSGAISHTTTVSVTVQ